MNTSTNSHSRKLPGLPLLAQSGWSVLLTLLLISGLLLAGCAKATEAPTVAPNAPTATADQSFTDLIPAAQTLVDQLAKGDYASAEARFDATMKGAMPEAKLKDAWVQVISKAGAFVSKLSNKTQSVQGYRIVIVTCQFEKAVIDVRVTYNDKGEVAGLYFQNGQAPATAATPQASDAITKTGQSLVDLMSRGDFEAVAATFDSQMKNAVNADKMKQIWQQLVAQEGAFQKQTDVQTAIEQSYQAVYVTCAFAKEELDVKLLFNTQGQLSGMQFVPAHSGTPYAAPDYAKTSSYHEQDVTVGSGQWALPGTLTLPNGNGPFPAVVLVHGSGPNDRDETIGPNKPFRDLAWGLASQGIAVLRYDKRTKAHSNLFTPDVLASLTAKEEVTDDALLAVQLLRQTQGIDPKRIFVLGHSLGATLAPRIGQQDPNLAGLVIMAGLTRNLEDTIVDQYTYLYSLAPSLSDEQKASLQTLKTQVARVKDPNLTAQTPAVDLPLNMPASYWLDLRGYKPAEVASGLKLPLLILQGARDYQVLPTTDFEGWKTTLANKSNVTFKLYPGLNHLFLFGTGDPNPQEYNVPGHVSKDVVDDIARWMNGK